MITDFLKDSSFPVIDLLDILYIFFYMNTAAGFEIIPLLIVAVASYFVNCKKIYSATS